MAILQRKILFGGVLVITLLVILSVLFLYQPKIQARIKIQTEINDLRKQINDMKEQVKGIASLRRQIVQLESQNAELMSHIAPRDQLLTLLRQLAKISERHNITFLEIRPPGLDTMLQAETSDKPIRPVPFQLVVVLQPGSLQGQPDDGVLHHLVFHALLAELGPELGGRGHVEPAEVDQHRGDGPREAVADLLDLLLFLLSDHGAS